MRHVVRLATLPLLLLAAGCDRNAAPYPTLLPTQQILSEPALPDHAADAGANPDAIDAATEDRADALRGRAEALRRPVIEPDFRARMERSAG